MMRFTLRSPRVATYESVVWRDSTSTSGVRYAIRKVSLGQRIELARKALDISLRNEFLRAGSDLDQVEATLSDLLVQRLYLEWALAAIDGLTIDQHPATTTDLIDKGPEELTNEILQDIRRQFELSGEERKNY